MPGNYYVHNIYKENVTSIFGQDLIERQLSYQKQKLATLNSSIAQSYSDDIGAATEYEEKMERLEKELPGIAQKMVSILPTINWNMIRGGVSLAEDGDISLLQKAITLMKRDIDKYLKFYDSLIKTGVDGRVKAPKWMTQKDIEAFKKNAERLRDIKSQLDNLLTANGKDRWSLSSTLSRAIGTIGGNMSEVALANLLTKVLGKDLKFEQVGGGTRGSYRKNTEDVGIFVTDETGEIKLNLPGISLKRTSTGTSAANPVFNIHIKSSSVGKLITVGALQTSGFPLEVFYNAYANHGREAIDLQNRKKVLNKVVGMDALYNAFHASVLATALTGSMISGDYGYYLVVNNQVFTAIDIIASVLSGGSRVIGGHSISLGDVNSLEQLLSKSGSTVLKKAQPYIAKYHSQIFEDKYLSQDVEDSTEASQRSAEIISKIDAINITLNLQIALNSLIKR